MEQNFSPRTEAASSASSLYIPDRYPIVKSRILRLVPIFGLGLLMLSVSFIVLFGFPLKLRAADAYHYVAASGNDNSDCTIAAPCRTIQRAINVAASSGDEIWVAAGYYTGTVTLNKNVILRGGYTTTNWFLPPDPEQNVTIIDGEGTRRVIYVDTAVSATVENFHIRNGYTNAGGAGVYNYRGTLTVLNCQIYNNHDIITSNTGGGGITNGSSGESATLILKYNRIFSNTSSNGAAGGRGGGIKINSGSALIEANHIYSNTVPQFGGGLSVENGDVTLRNNLIYNNSALNSGGAAYGGGIYVANGNVTAENNTIFENRVETEGGGVYNFSGTVVLSNSLIISNTANVSVGAGGIQDFGSGTLLVSYTDFYGNSPNDGVTAGTENRINQNPFFVDPTNYDLHLSSGSPAIDSGAITTTVSLDIDGEGRPYGSGIDRGADEYTLPGGTCFARVEGGQVYTNVQAAVDVALAGDVVQVAGHCMGSVSITQSLTLRGGYTVTDWIRPQYKTTLDGASSNQVVNIDSTNSVTVENLHIVDGSASNGAGVYINNSTNTTLQNNVFYNNQATNGGAVYVTGGSGTLLQHNTIYNNNATNQGSGVYASATDVTLRSNLVVDNTGSEAVYQATGATFGLVYNDFYGNSDDGITLGATDLSVPPGFVDAPGGDFHLDYVASQVTGRADPASPVTTDFENDSRPLGLRADIGADEARFFTAVDLGESPDNPYVFDDPGTIEGTTITFRHTITNIGQTSSLTDTFAINLTNNGSPAWQAALVGINSSVVLTAGVPVSFDVEVTVPNSLPQNVLNRTIITATSLTNGAVFDVAEDIIANPGVIFTPDYDVKGNPGEIITYTHYLTNTGPLTDTFVLTYVNGPSYWTELVTPQVITIGSGQMGIVRAVVRITDTAAVDTEDIMFITATSLNYPQVSATVVDTTTADATVGTRYVSQVPRAHDQDNNCTQSSQPCISISHAVEQASGGDDILVARGTYYDNLQVRKVVQILGDYSNSFHRDTPNGVEFVNSARTTIDAQGNNRVVEINGNVFVEGFTLQNGQDNQGGGVYIQSGAPVLSKLVITNSTATGSGGGVYVQGGQPVISQTKISHNTGASGGGIYNAGANLTLWNNFIDGNTATGNGGGGVYNRATLNMVNNTLYGNDAATFGGGIYHNGGTQLVIANTIVVSNTADTGGGIYQIGGAATLDYNDVWGNTATTQDDDSNIPVGTNSIAADPLFVDAAGGNLHLADRSPAIDVADPDTFLSADIDGDIRPSDQGYDIGADERSGCLARIVNENRQFLPASTPFDDGPHGVLQNAIDEVNTDPANNYIIQIHGTCRGVNTRFVSGEWINQTAILSGSFQTLALEGGYSSNFATRNPRNHPTVIDAQGQGRVVFITGTHTLTFTDLNLVNGYAEGLGDGGGGLYNYNNNVTLAGVVISNSQATYGGGIYNVSGTLTMTASNTNNRINYSRIVNNTASQGGGIYLPAGTNNNSVSLFSTLLYTNTAADGGAAYSDGGLLTTEVVTAAYNYATNGAGFYVANNGRSLIQRSVILSNRATGGNGAALYNSGILTLANTIAAFNNADGQGGGLYNQSPNLLVRHDTFYGNAAGTGGGGIYYDVASGAGIVNSSLIVSNTSSTGDSGIFRQGGSAWSNFSYNDVYNNSSNFTPDPTTNISADPGFVSVVPGNPDFLRLQGGSPAEDVADDSFSPVLMVDIENDPRPSNQGFDMGADEIAGCYVRNDRTGIVYGNIQVAVDAAQDNDFLQVSGTCQGVNSRFDGGAGQTVVQTVFLTKSMTIDGGYDHTRWNRRPDPDVYTTTLDALSRGRVAYITGTAVVTMNGLHLQYGNGDDGGGVYVGSGVFTMTHSWVHSNTAVNGGGLYNQAGTIFLFDNNQVYSNTATSGGAMYNAGGQTILDDNDLRGNDALQGGGFYHQGGQADLQNNIIRLNQADDGGGVYNSGSSGLAVWHNTFYANAAANGAGFYTTNASPDLRNNIFYQDQGNSIIYSGVSYQVRYNNIDPPGSGSTIWGGSAGNGGNNFLDVDPLLLDAPAGDFHLDDTSPVMDQGDPTMEPIFDFEGDLRPGDQGFDMGADERLGCLAKNVDTEEIFGNLQRAIDFSSPDDEIRVALGECRGVHMYGAEPISQTIHIEHNLTLFGQYRPPEFIDPFRGYETPNFDNQYRNGIPRYATSWATDTDTILNPNAAGRALLITGTAVVTMEGFRLVNGDAGAGSGGGLYVTAGSTADLSFLKFNDNQAASGGAVYNAGTLLLRGTHARNNLATDGGGIYNTGVLTLTTDGDSADGTAAIDADSTTAINNNSASSRGGGIYNASGGQLRLINYEPEPNPDNEDFDLINANSALLEGGGIYNAAGATLTAVRFHIGENEVNNGSGLGDGGGLFNAGTAILDPGNHFYDNYARQNGGGIYNNDSLTLLNNLIYRNTATGNGAGLYQTDSDANVFVHNTFHQNETPASGGAIYINSGSDQLIKNNIFSENNSGAGDSHAIRVNGGSTTIDYNDYWQYDLDNQVSGSGATTGTNSLNVDPNFISPGSGDFHVEPNDLEPPGEHWDVIDAAEDYVGAPKHDMELDPRPINTARDMGADEYNACLAQAFEGNTSNPRGPIRGRIMDALDEADAGDTIRLAEGTCVELVTINKDITFLGSWERPEYGEDTINQRITPYESTPVIQAPYDQDGPVINVLPTADTVDLDYIIIAQGHNPGGNGGGLHTEDTTLTLDYVYVYSNTAQAGGGVYVGGGDVTLSNAGLYGNTAQQCGGGFYASDGDTLITGVAIGSSLLNGGNQAPRGGGACVESQAIVDFRNVHVHFNQATAGDGGGVYVNTTGDMALTNVGFYSNTASAGGGGFYRSSNNSTALYHNTFRENTAQSIGGGVYNAGGPMVISASIVASNTASTDSGIAGSVNVARTLRWANTYGSGVSVSDGMIANPNFLTSINPYYSGFRSDYYPYELHRFSPAINSVPRSASNVSSDHFLDTRVGDPAMCAKDQGIDEYYFYRDLDWTSPSSSEVAPSHSITYTFGLANNSVHYIDRRFSPDYDYEEPGPGTGYTETMTVTVQTTQPDWGHEIVEIINGSDVNIINGLTATLNIAAGEVVSISVRVDIPDGQPASLAGDSSTWDDMTLHYDTVPWGCSEPEDPGNDSVRTRVALDRSFVIEPDHIGTIPLTPGESVVYVHTLTNTGNITDSYEIFPNASRYGESLDVSPTQILTVAPRMTATIWFTVTIHPAAAGGLTDRSYLVGRSMIDEGVFASAYDETPIAYITGTRYVALAPDGKDETFYDETEFAGWNIPDNNCTQSGSGDDGSKGPCRTIQHALSQAAPGDVIKITQGVFTDVVTVNHNGQNFRQSAFISKSITLQGGYTLDTWNEDPPNHISHTTIINPQGQGRAVYITTTGSVTLDRLTMRSGNAADAGGLVYNDGADLTIHANRLYLGSAPTGTGGGIYQQAGNLNLQNNILHQNTAANGGAVYVNNGMAVLENNTFYDNSATGGGGAVYASSGNLLITNTIFATNTAGIGGAVEGGGGVTSALNYNLYYNNTPDDVAGVVTGPQDFTADPLFADPAQNPADLHIQFGSPAIDQGDPATTLNIDYDNDARPQPISGDYDIGADERVPQPGLLFYPDVITNTVANSQVVITHTLQNIGEFADTFVLTYTINPAWPVELDADTVFLDVGEIHTVTVTYTVPANPGAAVGVAVITATSSITTTFDTVTDIINIQAPEWEIGKTVTPDSTIQPGGTLTYTITVTNVGELPTSGTFTISDELPAHTYFVNATPSAVLTTPVVQWVTDTVVATNTNLVFSYVVTVSEPLTDGLSIVNQVYTVTGGSTVADAVGDPVAVTVDAPALLTAAKTASHNPVQAGELLTYTITITNDANALGPALNVAISDTLPTNVTPITMGLVPPATGSTNQNGNTLWWLVDSIWPGETAEVTATVQVDSPLAAGTILTNTYEITTGNIAARLAGQLTTTVTSTNIITMHKTVVPTTTVVGNVVTYTVVMTNTGNGVANVAVTDALAAGFTPPSYITNVVVPGDNGSTSFWFTATTPLAQGTYPNPAITATYDLTRTVITNTAPVTLVAPTASLLVEKTPDHQYVQRGDTVTFNIAITNTGDITLTVETDDPGAPLCGGWTGDLGVGADHFDSCIVSSVQNSFTNTVVATGTPSIGSPVVFSDTARVTLITPTLEVSKLPVNQFVQSGNPVTFTIIVTNTGNITLTTVAISDTLDASCDDQVTDLPPSTPYTTTCSISSVTTDITNTVLVTGYPPAGQVVTGTASAYVQIITPSIRITKTLDTPIAVANRPVTFTIAVSNTGPVDLTNVVVVDPLAPDCVGSLPDLPTAGTGESYTCVFTPTVDVTNVATVTAASPGGSVSDSDAAFVDVLVPDLVITKSPAVQLVQNGDAVTFTITVTNTGDLTLTVAISDTYDDRCDGSTTLDPDESYWYNCSIPGITADFTNTVIATGTPILGDVVTGTADAVVQVINPSIALAKTPDTQTVLYNEAVTFTLYVTNTGDITLTNVNVTDPQVSTCQQQPLTTTLAADEAMSYTCQRTNATVDFTNIATVTAQPPVGDAVSDWDSADVEVIGPEIAVSKSPATQDVQSGDTVTFTISVTNTGDITLTNVTVDDIYEPLCDVSPADLEPTDVYSYICSIDSGTDDFTNTVIATGTSTIGGIEVSDQDSAFVNVVTPDIAIAKTPDFQYVLYNDPVTFTIYFTNTGDTNMGLITITDILVPDCVYTSTTIFPQESSGGTLNYDCSMANVTSDFTNTVVITAVPYVGNVVTDTSDAFVDVISPAIVITKTALTPVVSSGGTATFAITVTNTGDVDLDTVSIVDAVASACTQTIPTLPSGDSTNYTCDLAGITNDITNTAIVTGQTPLPAVVATDIATAAVTVINPAISVAKTPDWQVGYSGSPVTFTIYVTNTGDVALSPITVTDVLAPACNAVLNLAIGASTDYDCSITLSTSVDVTNTVVVTGVSPIGDVVISSDTAVVDYSPPARPTLISPPDQTFTNNPDVTFVWSPAVDAVTYTLNITGYGSIDVPGTSELVTLAEGVYTWTVRSMDSYNRTLGYTDTWRLTVDTTPPTVPVLITPTVGAVISNTMRPTFDWTDSTDTLSGPVTYTITITDSGGGVSIFVTTNSDFTPGSDQAADTYTWSVTAYDQAGNTSTAGESTFTLEAVTSGIYLPIILKNYTPPPPPPPRPDLVITDIRVTQVSGNDYMVEVTARNQSSIPVTYGNNFHITVHIDGDFDNYIFFWGMQAEDFGPGQSSTYTRNYTFPSGNHTLDAWIDPWDMVAESNETNNIYTYPGTIIGTGNSAIDTQNESLSSGPLPTPTPTP